MADTSFDLGNLTSVPLSAVANDAAGDIVTLPTVYSVSDASLVSLKDNGDGTAVASRVDASSAGTVSIVATVTNPDGSTVVGTLAFSLSAQVPAVNENAVNVTIVPGIPS